MLAGCRDSSETPKAQSSQGLLIRGLGRAEVASSESFKELCQSGHPRASLDLRAILQQDESFLSFVFDINPSRVECIGSFCVASVGRVNFPPF